jgi:hypothetical protein
MRSLSSAYTGMLIAGTLLALPAQAEVVRCHVDYGGTTTVIVSQPTRNPYGEKPVAVGSYFLFRIVFQTTPADLAAIKIYTYADRDNGASLLHQATYAYPPATATVNGFSGLNFVYEPTRDGELIYWCALDTSTGDTSK